MRLAGLCILLVGLLAAIVGTFTGCGSLFAWNGRHAVSITPIGEGPTTISFVPVGGRRYTVGIEVVFEREGLERASGVTVVEAQMPIVVRVKDADGGSLAEAMGWLDPSQPPNVLYGQAVPDVGPRTELRVERLLAPFLVSSTAPFSIEVVLGPDRVGRAHVTARRLVIHDDSYPGSIKRAFMAAGAGVVAIVAGIMLLVIGFLKKRRGKRGGV